MQPSGPYTYTYSSPYPVAPPRPSHPLDQMSWWWKIRHSLWILWVPLSMGMLNWVGFGYVAIRARRGIWGITAALYGAGFVVAVVLVSLVPDVPDSELRSTEETIELVGGLMILAMWFGGLVHALIVNRDWLRWRAETRLAAGYPGGPAPYLPPHPPYLATAPLAADGVVPRPMDAGSRLLAPGDALPSLPAAPASPFDAALADAVATRQRFDVVLTTVQPGPLRAALDRLSWGLDAAIAEVAQTAQRTAEVERTLARVEADDRYGADHAVPVDWALPGATGADHEHRASVARLKATLDRSSEHLRVLDARIDAVVARAAELAVAAGESGPAGQDLAIMVEELDALRAGLAEAATPGASSPL